MNCATSRLSTLTVGSSAWVIINQIALFLDLLLYSKRKSHRFGTHLNSRFRDSFLATWPLPGHRQRNQCADYQRHGQLQHRHWVDADVSAFDLNNATAIGNQALVDASNKVRLGNTAVTVIEGQVAFTAVSDKTKKENFKPVDGEAVLEKIRDFELSSWNFIGHDPKEFRHYGPMAQDFFAAFGHDGVGQIGSETTINSGDMAGILMIALQALDKRTAELKQKQAQIAVLESRLEALELRNNHSIQITAGKGISLMLPGE